MSQIKAIKAQVFKSATYDIWRDGCNPIPYQAVSTDFDSEGERWMVPQVVNGVVESYEETYEDASAITDAFKAVRLKHPITGDVIYILGTEADWLDRVNECCGDTPTMPEITLPAPNLDEAPCCETEITESDCSYSYNDTVGEIAAGQKIQLAGSNDGVAFTPVSDVAGFASYAAAITWANANWSAYGAFTAIKDDAGVTVGIKFTSSTVSKGAFKVSLLAQKYCLTVVVGDKFDKVTNNGVQTALPAEITVVDADQVIAAIKDYFGDATLTAFSATKINFVSTGIPLGYQGTNSRSVVAGVCS